MKRALKIDFIRFCIVGVMGFAINLLLLSFGHSVLKLPLFLAQVFAAEVALFHNFLWHHHWTYKNKAEHKGFGALIVQFHLTSWVAVLGSAALVSVAVEVFNAPYVLALVLSSGIALFWNFGWTKFVIWRQKNDGQNDSGLQAGN